jgi:hypothetical protein
MLDAQEKARRRWRRYNATPKGRERARNYRMSPKGLEAKRRYRHSPKGLDTAMEYEMRPERIAARPFSHSKAVRKKEARRRRDRNRDLIFKNAGRSERDNARAHRMARRMILERD